MSASVASRSPSTKPKPAMPRGDDDRLAERRGMKAILKGQIVPPVVARRQRLVGHEKIMQPARTGEADVIGGVEYGRGIAQEFARALDGDRLQKGLGSEPRPALEHVLKVRRREPGLLGDLVDR